MIKVQNLTRRFGARTAVDDVSFEVTPKEVLGFLGPNGAGKTTTLRMLTGYLCATSGEVLVDGHDVFKKPAAVSRVMGYLPENVPLYPELRVIEYLGYRARIKRIASSSRGASVATAIERCMVGDVQHRIIGQLSKGYRQRVGLADALLADPKILILDEPTVGLDPNQIRQIRDLILELGKERTVILSSHILHEVEAVCDRVLIINKGKLVGSGRPDELRSVMGAGEVQITVSLLDPQNKAAPLFKAVEGISQLKDISEPKDDGPVRYVIQADDQITIREQLFDVAVKNDFKIVEMSVKKASLEEIFVHVTADQKETKGGEL